MSHRSSTPENPRTTTALAARVVAAAAVLLLAAGLTAASTGSDGSSVEAGKKYFCDCS